MSRVAPSSVLWPLGGPSPCWPAPDFDFLLLVALVVPFWRDSKMLTLSVSESDSGSALHMVVVGQSVAEAASVLCVCVPEGSYH